MSKILALVLVAFSDVARSVWVGQALVAAFEREAIDPWFCLGVLLASGGISVSLLGLAMRAVLETRLLPEPITNV